MRCPGCEAECVAGAVRCAGCGAPLQLGDEPSPARLDRAVDLDRRWIPHEDVVCRELVIAEAAPDGLLVPPLEAATSLPFRPPTAPRAAEPTRRALAAGFDLLLLCATLLPALAVAVRRLPPGAGAWTALGWSGGLFLALLGFTYCTLAQGLMGATLGQRLVRLRVEGPDGARPGPGRSAVRAGLAVVGTAALGVGLLAGLFTKGGRGLHDLAAGTRVVHAP